MTGHIRDLECRCHCPASPSGGRDPHRRKVEHGHCDSGQRTDCAGHGVAPRRRPRRRPVLCGVGYGRSPSSASVASRSDRASGGERECRGWICQGTGRRIQAGKGDISFDFNDLTSGRKIYPSGGKIMLVIGGKIMPDVTRWSGNTGGKSGSPTRLHARADRTCPSGAGFQEPRPVRGCHRNRSPHRDMTSSRLPWEACHNPLVYCPRVPFRAAAGRERCGRPHGNRSGHARPSGGFPGAADSSGVPSRAAFTGDSPANRGFPPRFPWRTAGFGGPKPERRNFWWKNYARTEANP